jgi:hypothetical protein
MLAARMEEYYLQMEQPQEIETISIKISERLKQAGLSSTAHHVSDYLDDKYKRNKSISQNPNPLQGIISAKFVLEDVLRKDPQLERTKDEHQWLDEFCKRLETEREINRVAAKQKNIALDSDGDYLSKPQEDKVTTDVPDKKYRGPVYEELERFVKDLESYHKDMKETLEDFGRWFDPEKIPEQAFIKTIQDLRAYINDVRKIIAPWKDLKYATSMHNWFHTLLKFLMHGKHAGGVMTSIPSAKHFRTKPDGSIEAEKRPLTREQVGDRVPYVEDTLEDYADSKVFMSEIKAYFRGTKDWDRDDRIRRWRREFVEKLVHAYADDGDFYNHLSIIRQKLMDEEVAARRINARPKLSNLA